MALAAGFVFVLPAAGGGLQAQAAGESAPPPVPAEAYAVIDASTGQVLAQKNADTQLFPASITKILTLGLTLDALPEGDDAMFDTRVPASARACSELIPEATSIGLTEGEELTLRDLLYATQIESANDAANVLAEYSGGSMEAFAERMNKKAKALGLAGSQFTNPSGQPDDAHYTTAHDMAQITRWALTVPHFRELFAATQYNMTPSNKRAGYVFAGDNPILQPDNRFYYEGVTGSKMGYTDAARYTLVTTVRRGDMELICVVLSCPTHEAKYESTSKLLDYCFANYAPAVFPASAFAEARVPVLGGSDSPLGEIILRGQDVPFLLRNDLSLDDVTVTYDAPAEYVIGQNFNPTATLSIALPTSEQVITTVPLGWTGLDEILLENTGVLATMAQRHPVTFWVLTAALATAIVLLVLRVIYLRHARNKRRQERLAAMRAKLPIRIEDRPEPPSSRVRPPAGLLVEHDRRPARGELRVTEPPLPRSSVRPFDRAPARRYAYDGPSSAYGGTATRRAGHMR